MDKGTRVLIARGHSGKGVAGEIFWKGANKYGDGERLGVRGDDGDTYWVNSDDCDPTDKPAEVVELTGPVPKKGDRVRWTQGSASGEGRIFWEGSSKHGAGMRFGVEGDDGETRWLDQRFVEPLGEGSEAPAANGPTPPSGPAWDDDGQADDGYLGSAWDGAEAPDLGDEPPPPEPPGDWEEDDAGW